MHPRDSGVIDNKGGLLSIMTTIGAIGVTGEGAMAQGMLQTRQQALMETSRHFIKASERHKSSSFEVCAFYGGVVEKSAQMVMRTE